MCAVCCEVLRIPGVQEEDKEQKGRLGSRKQKAEQAEESGARTHLSAWSCPGFHDLLLLISNSPLNAIGELEECL